MHLELTIGPMFSGKTTKLINSYYGYIEDNCGSRVLMINHMFDVRYSKDTISTHDRDTKIKCTMLSKLNIITPKYINNENISAIFINEGQFFTDIVEWIYTMLSVDVKIYICGLDGDFQQKPFGQFLDLIPYSTKLNKLTAKCYKCSSTYAAHTIRVCEDVKQVLIGTNDIYHPICTTCLFT